MRRAPFVIAVVTLVAASTFAVGFSGAFFQDTDTTPQTVTADHPNHWLHLYSQSSDPQSRTGYAPKADSTDPAAIGTSAALTVDAGHRSVAGPWPAFDRAFVLSMPATLPNGATSVQVTATLANPDTHPTQPLQNLTLSALDGSATPNPETLHPGDERQVNFHVDTTGLGVAALYHAFIVIRLDFSDGSFLHYRVPVDVCTAVGAAC
jgi:hypothetical protein